MTGNRSGISRRQVLAGSGAAAVAAGTLGYAASASAQAGEGSWDREVDVVCVGSGAAAGTAAVAAASEGAEVIVLEKMPIIGGTTAKSGGVAWFFNHPIHQAQGIVDSKADAMRYAVRYGYPREYDASSATLGLDETRYKTLEAFYDKGTEAINQLDKLGAVKFKQFRLFFVDEPAPDYADHLPENKVPTGRALEPAVGSGSSEGGASLAKQLAAYLERIEMPILLDTRVTRIVRNAEGRVIGVEADQEGKLLRIKARKGVVFGTGGYSHNVELCRLHQPWVYGSCALPGSTGDFIPLAQEAGAKMGNLGYGWRTQVVLGEALANRAIGLGAFVLPGDSMILVNKYGQRCVNEKRDYNDRTKAHFHFDPVHEDYPNHLMVMLFDERSRDYYGGAFPLPKNKAEQPHLVEGATWDEVFAKVDAQLAGWAGHTGNWRLQPEFAANAKEAIGKFNGYAKAGKDPEFQRGAQLYDTQWHKLFSAKNPDTSFADSGYPNNTMHPFSETGPYYAIVLGPGTLDTAGGPQIDHNAQVLDPDNKPIPGLYGAGNCVMAPTGDAYLGAGGTIGPAVTYGYIAGLHAARS